MIYLLRMGMKLPPEALGVVRNAGLVLTVFVADATALYRLGGFLGVVLGFSALICVSQTRRLGRGF